MNRLDEAFDRLDAAVAALEKRRARRALPDADAMELDNLRAKAELDAALRAEAAETVRRTLVDLKALAAAPSAAESPESRADG